MIGRSIPRRYAFPTSSLRSPVRGCGNPFPLHYPSPANLRICRICIVLSFIIGTPLSSLVRRKLQRSTRRRGEKNLPALRSTPLRTEGLLFRSSHAAQDADLPALLMKCFVLETWVLSPMKRKKDSSACGLRMTEGSNAYPALSF